MKFLSDILAKAGLVVDGTVTFNSVTNATTDTDRFIVIDSGIVKYRTGAEILSDIGGQAAGSFVPTSRTLTINGINFDLSADRSWTITAGVSSVSAGTGISVNSTTGAVTVTNTGLLSAEAGAGISVSTTSGTLTITNTITNNNQLTNGAGYATTSYVTTQINNLVSGAPGLLDTLDELAAALGDDPNFATTITTALSNRLRIDINTQGLTSTQQGNGRTNLGLGSLATLSSVGNAQITDVAWSKVTGAPAFITSYTETDPVYVSERDSLLLNKMVHATQLWSNLSDFNRPSGYSAMIQPSSYQNPVGNHAYFHVIARRDAGGGYGVLLQSYNGGEIYHGNTTDSTVNINWYRIWNSSNFNPSNYYLASNPSGFITGYTETDTLATVTGRGASTTAAITISKEALAYGGTTQSFLVDGAAGNAAITINAATAYAYLNFAQAGVTKWEIGAEGAATNKGSLYFNHNIQVGSTGAALYLKKSNGYVGILNIDPQVPLHVTGAGTFSSSVTASSFVKSGGTSSQFLKADGSVDSSTYLTSYTETDTLATVTGRGATTSTAVTFSGNLTNTGTLFMKDSGPSIYENRINAGWNSIGDAIDMWINYEGYQNDASYFRDFRVGNGKRGAAILFIDGSAGTAAFSGAVTIGGNTVWHSGNLTNLNQLTNGPGYITGYTETDTLQSVVSRGRTADVGYTSYTSDGIYNAAATPVTFGTPHGSTTRIGYHDAGGGQYAATIGFLNTGYYSGLAAIRSRVSGEGNDRFTIYHSGLIAWGAGGASGLDTNLYRDSANVLKTDDAFYAGGSITTDGNIYISNNGGRLYFDRPNGATVGSVGWHTNDVFYVAGHPDYGPTAGNNVRVYGFGSDLHLGSSNAGDVITINNSGTINANYPIIATGGSGTTPTLRLDRNIATPSNYYSGLQLEVRATSGTAGIGLHRNGYSHVGIYHDSQDQLKFNMNSGTVIVPAGAGTLWGSGNLTNLNQLTNGPGYITGITSSNVTTALGYTPMYQAAQSGVNVNAFNGTGLYRGSTGDWSNRPTVVHNGGALLQIDTHPGNYHQQLFFDTGGNRLYMRSADAGTWGSWVTIWHSGNLTNLNQLTNGPGYITSYTETDTLATVTGRGASTTASISVNSVTGSITSSGNGDSNAPFRFGADYSGWMTIVAGTPGSNNGWGLFWAGNSGAQYGTNGAGGPGNIWSNSTNPNEYVFVGGGSTNMAVHGNTGNVWIAGTLIVAGAITGTLSGNAATATSATQVVTLQDNPPSGVNGKLWFETDTLRLKVYSSSASAWIDVLPVPDMALYYTKAGGAITGSVVMQQDLTVNGQISADGILKMNTSGTSYIRMGRFPQSLSNSGEAWIGRAADRSTGTMTVQLGGSSNGSFFEVVDYAWTQVTFVVGMNHFSYKGNTIYHAGNLTNLNQLTNGPGYITSSALSSYLPLSGGTLTGSLVIRNTGSHNNIRVYTEDDNSWIEQTKPDGTIVGRMGFDGFSTSNAYYTEYAVSTRSISDAALVRRIYINNSRALVLENLNGFSYNGNTVWHAGNLTNLNQLTNGPGYITSAANWFGAETTGGTTDWNHVTNTRPGTGYTLLLGSHTNGFGVGNYYHAFNLEYASKTGGGNVTQLAISYGTPGNDIKMRGRYEGTWSSWVTFINSGNIGSYALTSLPAHNHDGSAITTGTVANARTTASSSNGTDTIVLRNSSGYFDTEGIGINKYLYIGGYRVFSLGNLGADATQAKRYEIARLGIDYNDWNSIGTFEVELHESYYSQGLKKVYNIWYGYVSNSGLRLVEYRGTGSNNFRVVIGSEVVVSGDHRYLPVYVEVQGYSSCHVVVRTNRFITGNSNSGVGSTYIFTSPSGTNISNFSADGTPEITTASNAQIAGNTVWHAGNLTNLNQLTNGPGYITSSGSISGNAATATQVVTIQDSAPSGANGKLWWESDTGRLKVYYGTGSAWVDATAVPDMSLFYPKAGGVINGDVSILLNLTVSGNILAEGVIRSNNDIVAYYTSDIRLKDNIRVIESPVQKISKIRGVSFNWNDKQSVYGAGEKDYGVIAQEIEEVMPELVTTRDNGYKAVRYEKIVALLIEAIKEQQGQITELKNLVNTLTDKLNNI